MEEEGGLIEDGEIGIFVLEQALEGLKGVEGDSLF